MNDTRELLLETMDFVPTHIALTESSVLAGNKAYIVRGKCQQEGVKNANKREYPVGMFRNIVESPVFQRKLREKEILGEADHPGTGLTELKRVSHVVTDMVVHPDGLVEAEFHILPTPNGNIVKTLFEYGCKVAVSSRGRGSVDKRTGTVQEDYQFDTIDFVVTPSTAGSYPKPIGSSNHSVSVKETTEVNPLVTISDAKDFLCKNTGNIDLDNVRRVELMVGLLEHEKKLESLLTETDSATGKIASEIKQQLTQTRTLIEGSLNKVLEANKTGQIFGGSENMSVGMINTHGSVNEALLAKDNEYLKQENEKLLQANAELAEGYEVSVQMLNDLKDRYTAMEEVAEDAVKQYEASEKLVEAFASKLQTLQEGSEVTPNLIEQYEVREAAAVSLIEAAVRRIKEEHVWIEELGALCVAGEKLSEALVRRVRESILEAAIDGCLVNENEDVAAKLRPILSEAKNVDEVNERYSLFQQLIESKTASAAPKAEVKEVEAEEKELAPVYENKSEPLPNSKAGREAQMLNESAKAPVTTVTGNRGLSLARSIDKKLSGRG